MKKLITICAAVAAITGLAGTTAETGKSTPKGFTDDFDAAMTAAAKSEKNLWVLFTGSGCTGGRDCDGICEGCGFFDSSHIVYPCGFDIDPLLFHGVRHLQECG